MNKIAVSAVLLVAIILISPLSIFAEAVPKKTVHSALTAKKVAHNTVRPAENEAPINIFGKWEIYRFSETGVPIGKDGTRVKNSIGETIIFGKHNMYSTTGLTYGRTEINQPVKYAWETKKYNMKNTPVSGVSYEKGTLAYDALKDAQEGKTVRLILTFKDKKKEYFEVTNSRELAFYSDGYWVFLRHPLEKPAVKHKKR